MTMFANAVATASSTANLTGFGPGIWVLVGSENSSYDAGGVLTPVRYGVDGPPRFSYKHVTGIVVFDNATFGDPASGTVKSGFRFASAAQLTANAIASSTATAALTALSNTITPVNDRDKALAAILQRITGPVAPKSILLTSSAAVFNVDANAQPTPTTISFTAQALNVAGAITFATVPANVVLSGTGATRTLAYSDMPGNSVTVVASIVSGSDTYSSSLIVTKLFAGAKGDTGLTGNKIALAYLYQWAGAQPALPSGTATVTWASGATTGYTGADSAAWTIAVPANPGTVGTKLWVASKAVSALAAEVTSAVTFAAGAAVSAYAQNGANGAPGVKTVIASAYQWSISGAPTTTGSAVYTWATAAYDLVPTTGWTKTVAVPPGPGYTLYEASVVLVDSSGAATSAINWTTASIQSISYTGTNGTQGLKGDAGNPGATGNSARIAYTLVTGFSLATTPPTKTEPAQGLPTLPTWGETVAWTNQPGVPAAGQSVFQSDGLYYPATNQTIWNVPYLSALKVGNLSAISTNTGALTVSDTITAGGGNFTVNSSGGVVAKSISIQQADGTVILASGTALAAAYAAAGTLNSAVNLSASGILSGAGGGTVTIGGLGYSGAMDATKNTGAFATLAGQLTSANISTYMAAAAVDGATYIRNITTVSLAAGAVTTEKLNVGGGTNIVGPFRSTAGWIVGGSAVADPGPGVYEYNITDWCPAGFQASIGYHPNAANRVDGSYLELYTANHGPYWPITGGQRYEMSAYLSMHRCDGEFFINMFNQADQFVGSATGNRIFDNQQSRNIAAANFSRSSAFFTAPATATKFVVAMRQWFRGSVYPGGATSAPYIFISGIQVAPAKLNQTVLSDYQLGGSGTIIDQTGIVTPNLSAISATIGNLRTAASGARTEIIDNQISVYDGAGTLRVRIGTY